MPAADEALEALKDEFFFNCDGYDIDVDGVASWIEHRFDENFRGPLDLGQVSWEDRRIRNYALSIAAGTGTATALEADRSRERITADMTQRIWLRLLSFWQQTNPAPEIVGMNKRRIETDDAGQPMVICSCPK